MLLLSTRLLAPISLHPHRRQHIEPNTLSTTICLLIFWEISISHSKLTCVYQSACRVRSSPLPNPPPHTPFYQQIRNILFPVSKQMLSCDSATQYLLLQLSLQIHGGGCRRRSVHIESVEGSRGNGNVVGCFVGFFHLGDCYWALCLPLIVTGCLLFLLFKVTV